MHPLLSTALAAADAAAAVHRRPAGRDAVEAASDKGTSDFVSETDLEAQRAALEVIGRRHPGHRVLAEEDDGARGGAGAGDRSPLWIVDPLDGTTNYLHGFPMYGASVAVSVEGVLTAGAVVAPATGERWWALRGAGAWKGGRRIRVSGLRSLRRALVGTGFPFKALDLLPRYQEQLGRVLRASAGVRRGGAAALDLCYLATGWLDGFWELHLSPWDVAAGILVIQEAGGVVTRLDGTPVDLAPGPVLAANSTELLGALGSVLREGVGGHEGGAPGDP